MLLPSAPQAAAALSAWLDTLLEKQAAPGPLRVEPLVLPASEDKKNRSEVRLALALAAATAAAANSINRRSGRQVHSVHSACGAS